MGCKLCAEGAVMSLKNEKRSRLQQEAELEQQLQKLLPGIGASASKVGCVDQDDMYICYKFSTYVTVFQYFVIFANCFISLFKLEVMEEAARYIEKLQNNLIGQIRTHGYPEKLRKFSVRASSGSAMADDRDTIRNTVDNYVCGTIMK